MASLGKLFNIQSASRSKLVRLFSTNGGVRRRPAVSRHSLLCVGGASTLLAGLAGLNHWDKLRDHVTSLLPVFLPKVSALSLWSAESKPTAQPSVVSLTKQHALYLWIHLSPEADAKEVGRVCARLQKLVDQVVDPELRDEEDEIIAGVGFGPDFYSKVKGRAPKHFVYPNRKGSNGEMPSTGGDVFIHAKSEQISKLFELCQLFLQSLPPGSVAQFEDIYSFVYRNGRDLSGFIDGTENRADEEGREEVAVEKETGGSYVITQKWLHDLKIITTEKTATLESWVGRAQEDSTELRSKSVTSHVARMTSGNGFDAPKPLEIVRQSMPFGSLSGEHGLFFIAYANSPSNFNYMLDRMVGAVEDGLSDDIMKFSKNTKGNYWYFPGQKDLAKLA